MSSQPKIADSGSRSTFSTGAVRDSQSGKARFDLLPYVTLNDIYGHVGYTNYPYLAEWALATHFGMGAEKYMERNWEKGIPLHTYYNSAKRHCIKEICNWTDEPHLVALCWNLVCLLWTMDTIAGGGLPEELWTFPGKVDFIDFKLESEVIHEDTSIVNLLCECSDQLSQYFYNDFHPKCLISAFTCAMTALEFKERLTNGPQ